MSLIIAAALQAAAPPPTPIAPSDFDLAAVRPDEGLRLGLERECPRSVGDEIVVCGRRPVEAYPFAEMARLFREPRIMAEMDLGNGMVGRAYGEQVVLDRGAVSNRIMFGIRIPF